MLWRRVLTLGLLFAWSFVFVSCAGSQDDGDLDQFAGWYDTSETYSHDQGTQCPPVPNDIFENSVEIRLDGNQFEARFSYRWDVLKGEIREDGSFISTGNLGPDKAIRFNGDFTQDTLQALLDDINAGACTRTYEVKGTKRLGDQ